MYEHISLFMKDENFYQRMPSVEYISAIRRNYAFTTNGNFCMYVKMYVDYCNHLIPDSVFNILFRRCQIEKLVFDCLGPTNFKSFNTL